VPFCLRVATGSRSLCFVSPLVCIELDFCQELISTQRSERYPYDRQDRLRDAELAIDRIDRTIRCSHVSVTRDSSQTLLYFSLSVPRARRLVGCGSRIPQAKHHRPAATQLSIKCRFHLSHPTPTLSHLLPFSPHSSNPPQIHTLPKQCLSGLLCVLLALERSGL
jgi:hypothetical protein